MVAQPSKTRLLGYKSRDVSERENHLERHGERWWSLSAVFPLSSHFHLTTCLCGDVKAAR